MSTAINLPNRCKFQPDNEDTMNEIFSYITNSPAKPKFDQLIQAMTDRRLAMQLEEHAIDLMIDVIQNMCSLAK